MASSLIKPSAFETAYAESARISGRTTSATTSAAEARRAPAIISRLPRCPSRKPWPSALLILDTVVGARSVRGQPLAVRERRRNAAQRARAVARDIDHARPLLEIVHAQ